MDKFMTIRRAAQALGISESYTRRLVELGKLERVQESPDIMLLTAASVVKLLTERVTSPPRRGRPKLVDKEE